MLDINGYVIWFARRGTLAGCLKAILFTIGISSTLFISIFSSVRDLRNHNALYCWNNDHVYELSPSDLQIFYVGCWKTYILFSNCLRYHYMLRICCDIPIQ